MAHKMLVISNISKIRVSETPTLILFNIVIYKDLRSTAACQDRKSVV